LAHWRHVASRGASGGRHFPACQWQAAQTLYYLHFLCSSEMPHVPSEYISPRTSDNFTPKIATSYRIEPTHLITSSSLLLAAKKPTNVSSSILHTGADSISCSGHVPTARHCGALRSIGGVLNPRRRRLSRLLRDGLCCF
jgi:hypothetical protein